MKSTVTNRTTTLLLTLLATMGCGDRAKEPDSTPARQSLVFNDLNVEQ